MLQRSLPIKIGPAQSTRSDEEEASFGASRAKIKFLTLFPFQRHWSEKKRNQIPCKFPQNNRNLQKKIFNSLFVSVSDVYPKIKSRANFRKTTSSNFAKLNYFLFLINIQNHLHKIKLIKKRFQWRVRNVHGILEESDAEMCTENSLMTIPGPKWQVSTWKQGSVGLNSPPLFFILHTFMHGPFTVVRALLPLLDDRMPGGNRPTKNLGSLKAIFRSQLSCDELRNSWKNHEKSIQFLISICSLGYQKKYFLYLILESTLIEGYSRLLVVEAQSGKQWQARFFLAIAWGLRKKGNQQPKMVVNWFSRWPQSKGDEIKGFF